VGQNNRKRIFYAVIYALVITALMPFFIIVSQQYQHTAARVFYIVVQCFVWHEILKLILTMLFEYFARKLDGEANISGGKTSVNFIVSASGLILYIAATALVVSGYTQALIAAFLPALILSQSYKANLMIGRNGIYYSGQVKEEINGKVKSIIFNPAIYGGYYHIKKEKIRNVEILPKDSSDIAAVVFTLKDKKILMDLKPSGSAEAICEKLGGL